MAGAAAADVEHGFAVVGIRRVLRQRRRRHRRRNCHDPEHGKAKRRAAATMTSETRNVSHRFMVSHAVKLRCCTSERRMPDYERKNKGRDILADARPDKTVVPAVQLFLDAIDLVAAAAIVLADVAEARP